MKHKLFFSTYLLVNTLFLKFLERQKNIALRVLFYYILHRSNGLKNL